MKIVICGAMGYVGSALIELYRNEIDHEIIAVDKVFVPHIVASLPSNTRYIEGNILDQALMKNVLDGADVVYQMAAEVEAEKSIHKPDAIWENNVDGAFSVIDLCGPSTRIIFPSTGNVFGGVLEHEKNMHLTEDDRPRPKYPYAESKVVIEKYLLEHALEKNFTIVRFGTNYGFSPGIRFNLVTNVFTKRVLQGQDITVHGDGNNFRPTVHVVDAASASKFLVSRPEARGQIFHVVCESIRIRDLAKKAVADEPTSKLTFIAKKVPFSSYHLANEKILQAGYQFKFNLDSGIRQLKDQFKQIFPA